MLLRIIIAGIGNISDSFIRKAVRCQKASAAHTSVNITFFQLFHNLFGNVIRNHTLCRALCSNLCQIEILAVLVNVILLQRIDQLRERRRNIDSSLILNTTNTLIEHLLDNHCQIITNLSFRHFIQIHKHSHKRSLSVRRHERDDLILNHLYTLLNLLTHTHLGNIVYFLRIKL